MVGSLLKAGSVLSRLGEFPEAIAYLDEAHSRVVAAEGEAGRHMMSVAATFVECYELWHAAEPDAERSQAGAEWKQRLATLRGADSEPAPRKSP